MTFLRALALALYSALLAVEYSEAWKPLWASILIAVFLIFFVWFIIFGSMGEGGKRGPE